MSNFDVKVLAKLVEAALAKPAGSVGAIDTGTLFSQEIDPVDRATGPSPIGISLANLARLGCALPGGGFDAAVIFGFMTVTDLGIALYKACSDDPKRQSSAG